MISKTRWILFLAPVCVVFSFYLGAIITIFVQSLQVYVPGRIQSSGIFTLDNYAEYFGNTLVYYGFLWDTLRIAGISVVICILMAYPVAYYIVRTKSAIVKKFIMTSLLVSLLLNSIAKVYSWIVMLGDTGVINSMLISLKISPVRFLGTDGAVIVGIVHFVSTISVLALIGPLKNVNPTLEEASLNLGATRTTTFLKVTLPLSIPGIIASTLLSYALAISAFVEPQFLGKGLVLMMSNIIYARFNQTFNFPAGAALAVVLLVITVVIAYGIDTIMMRRVKEH